jgi:hypothetical protein
MEFTAVRLNYGDLQLQFAGSAGGYTHLKIAKGHTIAGRVECELLVVS